jgi:hypothetical protein
MQRLGVSGAVRPIYGSLGVKGLKLVFENATTGCKIGCRSVVNCVSQLAKIMLASQMISHQVEYVTGQPVRKTRFTPGRVRGLKNARNSVTVQNRTRVYTNFFDHKDLGSHVLQ